MCSPSFLACLFAGRLRSLSVTLSVPKYGRHSSNVNRFERNKSERGGCSRHCLQGEGSARVRQHLECRNCGPCLAKLDRSQVGARIRGGAAPSRKGPVWPRAGKRYFFPWLPVPLFTFSATFLGLLFPRAETANLSGLYGFLPPCNRPWPETTCT